MTKVKICGNTRPEDAKLAASLGADYLGLIFAESKRKIDLATAQLIVQSLPQYRNFVGVFMNQPKDEVEKTARAAGVGARRASCSKNSNHFCARARASSVLRATFSAETSSS